MTSDDGYEFPDETFPLIFVDGKFAGLKVICTTGSIAQYFAIEDLPPMAEDFRGYIEGLSKAFVESLVSWNLKRRGKPVPATLDGLLSCHPLLVTTVVNTWLDAYLSQRKQQARDDERDAESRELLGMLPHEALT